MWECLAEKENADVGRRHYKDVEREFDGFSLYNGLPQSPPCEGPSNPNQTGRVCF